jgi:uncharacterized protein YxeA
MHYHHCFPTFIYNRPSERSEKTEGLELNGTHQLIVCADVNLLSKNKNIIKKNTQALLDANKEVSLEVDTENIRYMFMSHHQTKGHHYIKVTNKSFENVAKFKYLRMMATNKK